MDIFLRTKKTRHKVNPVRREELSNGITNRKKLATCSPVLLICLLAIFQMGLDEASAQNSRTTTIEDILRTPVRDQIVTVTGQIVQHIEGNDYLLDDGTGQIILDGGPPRHHQIELPIGEDVTVTGEVGLGPPWLSEPLPPEIDLYSAVLQDGTEIKLRGYGRPPWAGSGGGRGDR